MKGSLLFAIDIDGTLLNSKQTIDEPNWAAIRRVMNEGHYISLATGRNSQSALIWARYLKTNAPVIALNGADVIDLQSGEALHDSPIAQESLLKLIFLAEASGLDYMLFGHDYVVSPTNQVEHLRPLIQTYYKNTLFLSADDVSQYLKQVVDPVLKVSVRCSSERELSEVYQELSSWGVFELVRTGGSDIEATRRGVSKLSGIRRVIENLDLSLEDVVAIGNGENDLEMLCHVGTGFAMANADSVVLEQVYLRTASNDESGVAKAIEHVLDTRPNVKFA